MKTVARATSKRESAWIQGLDEPVKNFNRSTWGGAGALEKIAGRAPGRNF